MDVDNLEESDWILYGEKYRQKKEQKEVQDTVISLSTALFLFACFYISGDCYWEIAHPQTQEKDEVAEELRSRCGSRSGTVFIL